MSNMLAQDKVDRIVELYNGGKTINYVAKTLNISFDAVERNLQINGITVEKKNRIPSKKVVEMIIELYINKMMSCDKIAKVLNIKSATTVRYHLNKNNIKLRTLSNSNKKYTINEFFFDEIDTQEKAYVLGLFYADGCNTGKRLEIGLNKCDVDILNKINKVMNSNRPILFRMKNKMDEFKDRAHLSFPNVYLCHKASSWGCTPRKSFTIRVPFNIRKDLYRHFIRGYFDGDGCLYINKQNVATINFVSGSTQFLNDLRKIFKDDLDINVTINNITLFIGGNKKVSKVLHWLYNDATIYMNRKFNKYEQFKKIKLRNTCRDNNLKIMEMFSSGYKLDDISSDIGITSCSINRYLKRSNLR